MSAKPVEILVTGARGFIGKNLMVRLRRLPGVKLTEYDLDCPPGELERYLTSADVIYHLAGVNRPVDVEQFTEGNVDLTKQICDALRLSKRTPRVVLSSSTQAELENPYGISKRRAEDIVLQFGRETGAEVSIFRLTGVFGKWCRPNYNSVVATFCYNIAHNLPITVTTPDKTLSLVHVDDVCSAMMAAVGLSEEGPVDGVQRGSGTYRTVAPSYDVSVGALARKIAAFRESRVSLEVPGAENAFDRRLYGTYLSYLDGADFLYPLAAKADSRGFLAEVLKSQCVGQIFVSRTKPGVTRGNHYQDSKTEKFLVDQGRGVVRFRSILSTEIIEHQVNGEELRVVDIPPGYAHSIENTGEGELVTVFWANEIFDPARPDTYFEEVMAPE